MTGFWRTASGTPLPENMNPYSVSTAERRTSAWMPLKTRCGRYTPAPWIHPRWNTASGADWTSVTSRWPYWSSGCPGVIGGGTSCPVPPESVTATAPISGIRTWTRRRACCGWSWGLERRPSIGRRRIIQGLPTWTGRRSQCTPPSRKSIAFLNGSSTYWITRRIAIARWPWKSCSRSCPCGTGGS